MINVCTKELKMYSQSEKSEDSSPWNQLSHVSRSSSVSDSSSESLDACVELSFHLQYSFWGFWLTLLEESLHQRSTAESAEKLLRVGPSVLTSSKSLRVELRFVLLSFLIFKVEKKCSTLAVEKGNLKNRLLTVNILFCPLHSIR